MPRGPRNCAFPLFYVLFQCGTFGTGKERGLRFLSSTANYCGMGSGCIFDGNIQGGGYSPRWVFGGRGCGGLGNFAAARHGAPAADRPGCGDSDRSSWAEGAGAAELVASASITDFCGFRRIARRSVAWKPSHGAAGSADFRALQGAGRLIVSLATRSPRSIAIRAGRGAAADGRRGGPSPFGAVACTDAGSRDGAGNLENWAQGPAIGLGCRWAAVGRGRKASPRSMGSGVRECLKRSAIGGAKGLRRVERVRDGSGLWVAHRSLCGDSRPTVGRA